MTHLRHWISGTHTETFFSQVKSFLIYSMENNKLNSKDPGPILADHLVFWWCEFFTRQQIKNETWQWQVEVWNFNLWQNIGAQHLSFFCFGTTSTLWLLLAVVTLIPHHSDLPGTRWQEPIEVNRNFSYHILWCCQWDFHCKTCNQTDSCPKCC